MQRFALTLAFLSCLLPCLADTVLTKSGEKYEGKILTETDDFVTIEIPFSETIMEKRIVPRADIATVEKVADEEIAYERLKATPNPDLALSPGPINDLLNDRLRPFVEEYPNFVHKPELVQRIRGLEAESERLEAGDIKLFGIWLAPSQQAAEKYQIEAARLFVKMREYLEKDAFGSALNEFSVLVSKYPQSIATTRAIPLARNATKSLKQQLDFALNNLSNTLAKRQRTLDLAGIADRSQVQGALDRQDAYAVSLAERAKSARQDFYQILDYDEKGLTQMRVAASKVEQAASKLDRAPRERAIKDIVQAHSFIASEEYAAAETTIKAVGDTWPKYEGLARLKQLIDTGKRELAAKQLAAEKAAVAEAEAAQTATPAP